MIKVRVVNDEGKFPTFEKAFEFMHTRVAQMVKGGTTWQMLETTCWMTLEVNESGQIGELFMDWYQARDFAHYLSLFEDEAGKKLKSPLPVIRPELTVAIFAGAEIERRPVIITSLLGERSRYRSLGEAV